MNGFIFRVILLASLLIVTPLIIPLANTQDEDILSRKTILWYYPTIDTWITMKDLCSWCSNHSINVVAVYPDMAVENRTYLRTQGIDVYRILITAGKAWDPPPANNNYTDNMKELLHWADGYDGIILDDTHNLWYYAHQNGLNDLSNYQAFLDYVDLFLVPRFGPDNTIVEMCIYGDNQNFTRCKQLNASCTFSYYYPPTDTIEHSGPWRNETYGVYFNTTASAWDIKSWYDSYGLNEYHAYEGWLWFNNNYSSSSVLKTYDGIFEFGKYYAVNNLEVWNFERLYNDSAMSSTVGNILQAFLEDKNLKEGALPIDVFILLLFFIFGICVLGIYAFKKLRRTDDSKRRI